jgi:hypothetical protein
MSDMIQLGDKVEIRLDTKFGEMEGWYHGIVFRIEPIQSIAVSIG